MGKNKKKRQKISDPANCEHCTYIGGGDFLCDWDESDQVLVLSDWEATDDYMRCRGKKDGP